jgi:lipoprotein NlpD
LRSIVASACAVLASSACIVSPTHQAPIEERSKSGPVKQAAPAVAPQPPPAPAPAAVTREAHDGQYVVQSGDTLYSIALAFGQDARDLARWNSLGDTTQIHVGQTLRVAPPAADEASPAEATPVPVSPSGSLETRPLTAGSPLTAQTGAAPPAAAPQAGAETPGAVAPPPPTTPDKSAAEAVQVWAWPSAGKVVEQFDETRNKGIDISGNVGDPVWAANDGEVVYSGSNLHGYGKLVIIKHTDDYVSAYAHNNEILVTQGQAVKRGQHIADLGMTDAASPRLHFEIRRHGTPVDPLTYLPSR